MQGMLLASTLRACGAVPPSSGLGAAARRIWWGGGGGGGGGAMAMVADTLLLHPQHQQQSTSSSSSRFSTEALGSSSSSSSGGGSKEGGGDLAAAAARLASGELASTSSASPAVQRALRGPQASSGLPGCSGGGGGGWLLQQWQQQQQHGHLHEQQQQQQQQARAYRGAIKRARHPLPPELAAAQAAAAAAREPRAPPPPLEPRPLTLASRRAGVVAVKAGMTQEWDEYGARVPLTVLWVDGCFVLRHKTRGADGTTALVMAAGARREKRVDKRQLGEFAAWGAPAPARKLWEVPVSDDALLPPGTPVGAGHFRAGQYLDVTATSKGKGFAGVMKRWGFAGQPASHGNTKSHRRAGSIGGRTDPGKVWKGKKMPGRLGGDRVTVKNVWLYKVDPARNLLFVRGAVPGPAGAFVLVRDAFRWRWAGRAAAGLPMPTALLGAEGAGAEAAAEAEVARRDGPDPYLRYRADVGEYAEGATWKTE